MPSAVQKQGSNSVSTRKLLSTSRSPTTPQSLPFSRREFTGRNSPKCGRTGSHSPAQLLITEAALGRYAGVAAPRTWEQQQEQRQQMPAGQRSSPNGSTGDASHGRAARKWKWHSSNYSTNMIQQSGEGKEPAKGSCDSLPSSSAPSRDFPASVTCRQSCEAGAMTG